MMRVQMVNAFKLSMRLEDQPIENDEPEEQKKEKAWWESGYVINPEKRAGLLWGIFKTFIIFISLFSLTYTAAFMFSNKLEMIKYEMFFDLVQVTDIILTCFTALRSRDVSEATRAYF